MIEVATDPELPSQIPLTPMNVFPTMGSLQDVVDLAEASLPIVSKNEIVALLAMYHNTLLKELNDSSSS